MTLVRVAFLSPAILSCRSSHSWTSPITCRQFAQLHVRQSAPPKAIFHPIVCANSSDQLPNSRSVQPGSRRNLINHASSTFVNLFPLWVVLASILALSKPSFFSTLTSPSLMQTMLSLLMLSTGLTLSPPELIKSFRKPLPVLFVFIVCYVVMPVIALVLSHVFCLEPNIRAGLLLLSMISGGQASNLCTHIAGGDTALSVTMTTSTTLAASILLPILSSVLLGTVVSVDRIQLALTTARVTLLPIVLGAAVNQLFPKSISFIHPLLPVMGITAVIFLVLGPVAQSAGVFAASWNVLLVPVFLLHVLGGIVGFFGPVLMKSGRKVAITTAFETAFKSPVLSFVLAKRLFPPGVELASAISIVILAPVAASFAIVLKQTNLMKAKRVTGPNH